MSWLRDMFGRGKEYRPNYDYVQVIRRESGDPWLWNQDWRVWGSPAVRNLMHPRYGNRLFQQEGAAIDRAYSTARTNALASLNRSGLGDSGAGALLRRELGTMRGQAIGEARSRTQLQADTTQAQFAANYWSSALDRQAQMKGARYGWLSNADQVAGHQRIARNQLATGALGSLGEGLGGWLGDGGASWLRDTFAFWNPGA